MAQFHLYMHLRYAFLGLALAGLTNSASAQTFLPANDISTGVNGAFGVAVGDLDGDGLVDIVSVGRVASAIYWQKNLDGTFSSLNTVATGALDVRNAVCDDFDGDGDIDIAASITGGAIGHVWYANDGTGSFGSAIPIVPGAGAIDLLAADLDDDGDVDLGLVNLQTDRVYIAWNDGAGGFTDTLLTTTQNGPRGLDFADINSDGTLDLVVASRNDNEVAWYPNNGDGTFGAKEAVGTVNEAFSVSCADLNGDGTQDVVSAGNVADQVVWWPNAADSFSVRRLVADGIGSAVDAITGDFDLDGDQDVITLERGIDRMELYSNDGNGTFSLDQILTMSANGVIDAKATDLDNDGDLDVVVASEFDNSVTVFINTAFTAAICPAPTLPMASPTSSSAVVSWTGAPNHIGYLVQGRVAGAIPYRFGLAMDTFRTTGILFPGVTYEWKVTARCSDGSNSESTPLQSFTTLSLKAGVAAQPVLARSGEAQFQLSGLPEASLFRAVDMNGRLVASFNSPNGHLDIDASLWASGLYILEWSSPEGENGTMKLVR